MNIRVQRVKKGRTEGAAKIKPDSHLNLPFLTTAYFSPLLWYVLLLFVNQRTKQYPGKRSVLKLIILRGFSLHKPNTPKRHTKIENLQKANIQTNFSPV